MRHHDRLWFIERHIWCEKPANEPGGTTIEPGDGDDRTRESDGRTRGPANDPELPGCRRLCGQNVVVERVGRVRSGAAERVAGSCRGVSRRFAERTRRA